MNSDLEDLSLSDEKSKKEVKFLVKNISPNIEFNN